MEIKDLVLITKLKEADVTQVTIYFDGAGDDGDIQEVEYLTGESNDDLTDGLNNEDDELLRDKVYTLINNNVNKIGDWVNNDGGYGYVYINVEKMSYTIDYYQRTVEECQFPSEPLFI